MSESCREKAAKLWRASGPNGFEKDERSVAREYGVSVLTARWVKFLAGTGKSPDVPHVDTTRTPEHKVWAAVNTVPGEAYEARDVCVITGLPAVVVESVLSNLERKGLVWYDEVNEWYEARPTTLDAPWYGCGCSPYLYPTPGQLVVLANGDVVEVQGFDPNPYAVLVSGMGWLGQYRWQVMLTGLPIDEVWSGRKKPIPPWRVTGDGSVVCGQPKQLGMWDD